MYATSRSVNSKWSASREQLTLHQVYPVDDAESVRVACAFTVVAATPLGEALSAFRHGACLLCPLYALDSGTFHCRQITRVLRIVLLRTAGTP